jgi:hypothetical protein
VILRIWIQQSKLKNLVSHFRGFSHLLRRRKPPSISMGLCL